jgi:MoaA/NifB/PqqE/SkfB family radical SAM enzyme
MSYVLNNKNSLKSTILKTIKYSKVYKSLYSLYHQRNTKNIRLDFCSQCQLQCPLCSTGTGKNKNGLIGAGRLRPLQLETFIKLNTDVKKIETSNWGEIFLNEKLPELMKIASQNNIELTANNGVNFNTVSDSQLEALVKYQFKDLRISVDGITQEVYEKYRVKGDLDSVLLNIRKLNALKLKHKSKYPRLTMQFIDFPHNSHQQEDAKKLAVELNMKFNLKSNHSPNSKKFISRAKDNKPVKVASRQEFLNSVKSFYSLPCRQLFEKPQVNWDGNVLGCCINKTHSFGNAFENSMTTIKSSDRYKYAMKMVTHGAPPRDDIPCSNCIYYKKLKQENKE